jgi:hypothetical protein
MLNVIDGGKDSYKEKFKELVCDSLQGYVDKYKNSKKWVTFWLELWLLILGMAGVVSCAMLMSAYLIIVIILLIITLVMVTPYIQYLKIEIPKAESEIYHIKNKSPSEVWTFFSNEDMHRGLYKLLGLDPERGEEPKLKIEGNAGGRVLEVKVSDYIKSFNLVSRLMKYKQMVDGYKLMGNGNVVFYVKVGNQVIEYPIKKSLIRVVMGSGNNENLLFTGDELILTVGKDFKGE